jgi:adenylate kinase family enzyme
MRRVSVVGNSGSGKTTVARAISDRLGLPHLELDGIYHQPGWSARPEPEMRRLVIEFVD